MKRNNGNGNDEGIDEGIRETGSQAMVSKTELAGAQLGPVVGSARSGPDGSQELVFQHDTAAAAIAAQTRAQIESARAQAMARPRNWMVVGAKLLEHCKRPGFAKLARYSKPVGGKKVEGPSIRFAEAAMRELGNVMVNQNVTHDDARKRIINVQAFDLEANLSIGYEITVEKTVERKTLGDGRVPLSQRTNTEGEITYKVEATDDELITKQNNMISKAMRNCVLRLVPADIMEECMEQVKDTVRGRVDADPITERKRCAEGFAKVRVTVPMLDAYLGHPLAEATTEELADLLPVYEALNTGEAKWEDFVAHKGGAGAKPQAPAGKGVAGMKADAARRKGEKGAAADPPPPAEERQPGGEG